MSKRFTTTRRTVLQGLPLIAGAAISPISTGRLHAQQGNLGKQDRIHFAAIGVGGRGTAIASHAKAFGDVVAVCDVDRQHAQRAREQLGGKAQICHDFRAVLERDDVHAVTIGTPDHWHVPIAIAACRAGKDVYCEKPMTLTVEEGQRLKRVVRETGRVFQVGSQQRSEFNGLFLRAVAMVHAGRLGNLKSVLVSNGAAPRGGPFPVRPVPAHLDWNMWLGPAPKVPYIPERCHQTFRWWFDYSGGMMTDWGAHHLDIAHWAMAMDRPCPVSISGTGQLPDLPNAYNTPAEFEVNLVYPGGLPVKLSVKQGNRSGVLFEGDQGRIFVSRNTLAGKPVDALADDPLPEDALTRLYRGKQPGNHMRNFVECVWSREQPISDVESQYWTTTALHLANISVRLGRPLKWDRETQQFDGDAQANAMLGRPVREGFEWLL